jgi:hypothetical protein
MIKSSARDIEKEITDFWNINRVKEQVDSMNTKKITLYDGPPYLNGKPHQGHHMSSLAKDTIIRYLTSTGYSVARLWGWDMNHPECSMKYLHEWTDSNTKLARWVDNKDGYRTDDQSYQKSVEWAFQELKKKGLISTMKPLSPYCVKCLDYRTYFEYLAHANKKPLAEYLWFLVDLDTNSKNTRALKFMIWDIHPWHRRYTQKIAWNKDIEYVVCQSHDPVVVSRRFAQERNMTILEVFSLHRWPANLYDGDKKIPVMEWSGIKELVGTGIAQVSPCNPYMEHIWDSQASILPETPDISPIGIAGTNTYIRSVSTCPICNELLVWWPYRPVSGGPCLDMRLLKSNLIEAVSNTYWEPRSARDQMVGIISDDKILLWPLLRKNGLDGWFESACVPFASIGYPQQTSIQSYPAEMVVEGRDQIYGWFLACILVCYALFSQSPFRNVIANGLVMDNEGNKLSKSLNNAPPLGNIPADSYRCYLLSCKVLGRENSMIYRPPSRHPLTKSLISLHNQIIPYLTTRVSFQIKPGHVTDIADNWILQAIDDYLTEYHDLMKRYKLGKALILAGLFQGKLKSYLSLHQNPTVLLRCYFYYLCSLTPFAPFLTEKLYQLIKPWLFDGKISIHLYQIPCNTWTVNKKFLSSATSMFNLIKLIKTLQCRRARVCSTDDIYDIDYYVREATGCSICYDNDVDKYIYYKIIVRNKSAFGDEDLRQLKKLSGNQIRNIEKQGYYQGLRHKIYYGSYVINTVAKDETFKYVYGHGILVIDESDQVLNDDVVRTCQNLALTLKKALHGKCVYYIYHRPMSEIEDEKAKLTLSNLNDYTLPILGQMIYKGIENKNGSEVCDTISLNVYGEAITIVIYACDLDSRVPCY